MRLRIMAFIFTRYIVFASSNQLEGKVYVLCVYIYYIKLYRWNINHCETYASGIGLKFRRYMCTRTQTKVKLICGIIQQQQQKPTTKNHT